ncbi:hypothetical protein ANOBCDAF_00003 [Pleomorphomonas sp. T1.2MG-36]|nr:hypothetical protein ANOBCDAF_00003 [Pleomorphomonas sp. T1.2MG-36]
MSSNRDDFSEATRRALAGRAGHRCSICKTPTTGPSDESPASFMNVGIASHITAAAPGQGARRYDSSLTPEQRSDIDNGIWLCRSCDGIVDRDAVRFPPETLKRIRRDHTEFARLGTRVETEVGLIAIGPNIVAGGQVVRFNASGIVLHLAFFLQGSAEDLFSFVRHFDAQPALSRYVLLSELGLGGLLAEAPEVAREGVAWNMTFQWLPGARRRPASELAGMSRHTGKVVSGEEYWKQTFEAVLEQPPATWFANMEGGSHLSELYDALRGSTWFEHLVKCELVRLACVPAPARLGRQASEYPPLVCVRHVLGVRIPDATPVDDRLRLEVDFDLEGHGRWTGNLSLHIYSQEALRRERAKAAWMAENIRRIEKGGRMLPSPVPPDGWDTDDGYPD